MNRNKTIILSDSDLEKYKNKCIDCNKLNDFINKTIKGDSFEVLSKLPEKCVDLLIVDPPYNLRKKYNNFTFNELSDDAYKEYTEKWIKLVKPLLKDTGTIYVCCDWKSSLIIGNVLKDYFLVQNRITWREKGRYLLIPGASKNWKNDTEDIWFATNSEKYTFNLNSVKIRKKVSEDGNFRDTCPSNFWDDITVPFLSMSENTTHPTQKSEKLIAKLILASSNENDVILDPFVGSGTTSVVAKKLNRKYIGIEMDNYYCALTEYRLDKANIDTSIQGYKNGIFFERNYNNK